MNNIYLLNIIKQNKNKFSTSEDALVDYFLQLKNDELVNKTLADMASDTDISQTTIYNFVKNWDSTASKTSKLNWHRIPSTLLNQNVL